MSLQLFEKFVKGEELLGHFDELFNVLYTFAAGDFDRAVRASVYLVAFGAEYSLTPEELYRFDRAFAEESWFSFVENWINECVLAGGYQLGCAVLIVEKIDTLIDRFVEWLRTLDPDKLDAELATQLLTGEVSERDIALKGLAAYLHTHCAWPYPN